MQEVDYVEPSTKVPEAARVPFERHAEACLAGNFGKLKPLEDPR